MKKNLFALLFVSISVVLVNNQYLKAQTTSPTNTKKGVEALESNTSGIFNTAMGFQALRANTTGSENSAHGANSLRSNTTGNNNTANGYGSLFSNTIGNNNSANGHRALVSNTTGSFNTASGMDALFSNTTASGNTATGYQALYANTTGYENTANGYRSLYSNTVGFNNSAIGFESLYANTTGNQNTASGRRALHLNTTGLANTAQGHQALYSNTTGDANTATGADALVFNTTGFHNTGLGTAALKFNTTGYYNTASGTEVLLFNTIGFLNTGAGSSSLKFNTTGAENTATGANALQDNITGNFNTANGNYSLRSNTNGNSNAAFGHSAGNFFNSSNSTFIGAVTGSTTSVNNSTALGYGATVWGDNQIRIGNSAVTSIGGEVEWTTFSDGRFKKNIQQDVPGLEFINELRPVTYTLDVNGIDGKLMANKPSVTDKTGKAIADLQPSEAEQKAKVEKAKIKYTGFVAQEVEEAARTLNYDFSGVDVPKNKEDFYGLRYSGFMGPVVKAVQELSVENKQLKKEMQQQIDDLKQIVTKLINGQSIITKGANNSINLINATLEQNVPNPLIGSTNIRYHLPHNAGNARVVITNMKGQMLKSIDLNSKRDGQITLNAGTFAAGSYTYSLWVNGTLTDSKQMLIQK